MIPTKLYNIKFYCPPMSYKLWYENDMGDLTHDNNIPPDIIPQYLVKIRDEINNAPYFIRVNHPNVIGIAPDVDEIDGNLYGILKITTDSELSQDDMANLQDSLTNNAFEWSVYFENHEIKTDGGSLYIHFYDNDEPILSETAFNNRQYVNRHSDVFDSVRFYMDENSTSVRMLYYNPDSSAGGQLVDNYLYPDVLKEAFAECKTEEEFWNYIDENARQYLIDIDTAEFADEAKHFTEEPYNCSGENQETMDAIQNWTEEQYSDMEQVQSMNM